MASVMLCASVNEVIVFTSIQPVVDDQQQPEHEQQVVDAEQDVLRRRAARSRARARRRAGRAPSVTEGVGRPQQVALQPAVRVVDAHQHVGDRGLEPRDRDRLPREPARAA